MLLEVTKVSGFFISYCYDDGDERIEWARKGMLPSFNSWQSADSTSPDCPERPENRFRVMAYVPLNVFRWPTIIVF